MVRGPIPEGKMAGRLSSGEATANIGELNKFRAYWRKSDGYPGENYGNDHVHMPVEVEYTWAGGRSKMTFETTFRAFIGSGPNDGSIDLDDTAKVRIEDFHLNFKPMFQDYQFDDDDNSLTIRDSSAKMGGKYSVKVMPTLEEPE